MASNSSPAVYAAGQFDELFRAIQSLETLIAAKNGHCSTVCAVAAQISAEATRLKGLDHSLMIAAIEHRHGCDSLAFLVQGGAELRKEDVPDFIAWDPSDGEVLGIDIAEANLHIISKDPKQ